MQDAINLFIIEDLQKYIDLKEAKSIIEEAKQGYKKEARQLAIAKAIIAFIITYNTFQQYQDKLFATEIWTKITAKAS